MSSDDPANDISGEAAGSNNSSSSEEEEEDEEEEEEDNPSALKWLQGSINSGWGTLNRSVNKLVNKFSFYKPFSKWRSSTQADQSDHFHDFFIEENDSYESLNLSTLRENYLNSLARKLSCILEAEERLEEEERERRYKIRKRLRQFISTVKNRAPFKRRDSPLAEEFKPELDEFKHDIADATFEFYVNQEKLRRRKKYIERKRDLVVSNSSQKKSSSTAKEKLPLETDQQSSKQKQSLPGKRFHGLESKTPVKSLKAGQKTRCTVRNDLVDESLDNKVAKTERRSSPTSTHVKSSPTPCKVSKTATQEKHAEQSVRSTTRAQKVKFSENLDAQRVQPGVTRKPTKVQTELTDEHTEWPSKNVAPCKKDTRTKTCLPKDKQVDSSGPPLQQSVGVKRVKVKTEKITTSPSIQPCSPPKPKIQHEILKSIRKDSVKKENTGGVAKSVVVDEEAGTTTKEESVPRNDIRQQHTRKVDSTKETLKKVIALPKKVVKKARSYAGVKDNPQVDVSSEVATNTNEFQQLAPERRLSDLEDNTTKAKPVLNLTKLKSSQLTRSQETIEIDIEFEDGVCSSSSTESESQPHGFAKFFRLLGFSSAIRIRGDELSATQFEGNSAVPPIALLRGNKSFSDTFFKIKLRATRQMRNHSHPKAPLQESAFSNVEKDTVHQNKLLPGSELIPHIPICANEKELTEQSFLSSGLKKRKLINDFNDDCWQRVVAIDFSPSDAYLEERPLPSHNSDSSFNQSSSFFDLLHKLKWRPGSSSKKKIDEDELLLHEHDFYSPRDYLDKYGIPIPTKSSNSKVEDEFIFERAWNKTVNQLAIVESESSKLVSNAAPEKPCCVSIHRAELVTNERSAANQRRRSSRATKSCKVKAGSSSSRQVVDYDPSNYTLKRPKTFLLDHSADKADDNDDDDSDEDSDSDSDDSDSDDSEEEDDDKSEEEELRPRDRDKAAKSDETETNDPGKNKSLISTKASRIMERIVSMFSLNSTDGVPDEIKVLDIDAVDNIPEPDVAPESIVITDIKSEESKLDPAFNICVDLKARRKEELTKLLVRATGNKYMTEYFRLEIEKRAEKNGQIANTSKASPCSAAQQQQAQNKSNTAKLPDDSQLKSSSAAKVAATTSSHSTAEEVAPESKRFIPHQENKKDTVKKPATQRKLSKDNSLSST